ncbi:hypothetical protein DMENIID0001_038500 [Sergentomyia squamirostris]
MTNKPNHLAVLIIFLMTVITIEAGIYNYNITNFACIPDEEYCLNHECTGVINPPHLPVYNISCTFPTTFTSLKVRVVSYYKYTVYRKSMIDHTEDFCDYVDNRGYHPIGQIFNNYFLKYSNFRNKKCPFKNGTYSYINLPLSLELLPPSFPDGDYRFDIHMSNQFKRQFLLMQMYATIRTKGLSELLS